MLKQNKNLKFKYKKTFKPSKKETKKFTKFFKYKPYLLNSVTQKLHFFEKKGSFKKKLQIRITPNNIFCTLQDLATKKTLLTDAAGKLKLKISKKTLRFNSRILIQLFLNNVKKYIGKENIILILSGPIKIRKTILKQISSRLKKNTLIINVKEKKCFNGCRQKKKRRKKQKGLRIFK